MEFVQSDTSNNGNGGQAGLAEQQSQQQGFGQSARDGQPAPGQGGEGLAQGQENQQSDPNAQGVQRVEDDAINLWM